MKEELQTAVMEICDYSKEQVADLHLPNLMTLIEMKDTKTYNHFKMKLRGQGYII